MGNSGLYVGWGLSGVFCVLLRGHAVRFVAARFSGDFGYVFQSSPRRYFFGHCLGKDSGANLYWERFIGCCRGLIWNILHFPPQNPAAEKSLFLSLAFFEFFDSKGRLFGGFGGKTPPL